MKKSLDNLGDRMKGYEQAYRQFLPKRLPVMIRIDGKAFHTYTKGMKKPFDEDLAHAMWETTKYLCEHMQGAKIGYTQSDEITILLTNYEKLTSESWFNSNLQKMCSVAASLATARFNEVMRVKYPEKELALFDARVWVLPEEEVCNAFLWRQQDATKNSISMVAQANFPHKELQGLKSNMLQDKLWKEAGINWNDLPIWQKRGVAIIKKQVPKKVTYQGETKTVMRNVWEVDHETPIFSQDREYVNQFVYPKKEEEEEEAKEELDFKTFLGALSLKTNPETFLDELSLDEEKIKKMMISFAEEHGPEGLRGQWSEMWDKLK